MTVRALDPVTGDIITNGHQFISGIDEVKQTVGTRMRLFVGEYFRDVNEGTPWFQTILGKSGTLTAKNAAIKNRILNTPNVIQLTSFTATLNPDNRTYYVSVGILTTYGQLDFTTNGNI